MTPPTRDPHVDVPAGPGQTIRAFLRTGEDPPLVVLVRGRGTGETWRPDLLPEVFAVPLDAVPALRDALAELGSDGA